jgi:hypothetical protein
MNKIEWTIAVIIFTIIFWGGGFRLYSNYQVCKTYFPKIDPMVCMSSSKTAMVPRE